MTDLQLDLIELAARCRRLAHGSTQFEERAKLLELAEEYEAEAAQQSTDASLD